MKKFINNVDDIVDEMIEGMVLANQEIIGQVVNTHIVYAKHYNNKNVALVSGGGSGHEPAHGGFVGEGMLSAAVAGPIFTSPGPDQIYQAIKTLASDKGTLLIVKNYTGDVMNFEIAQDMIHSEKKLCEMVVVNDDVALENSTFTTGQRGIAGTIFVHKIAGAKAQQGADLISVKKIAEKVINNVASYGISLDACTVPANGGKGFIIPNDEVEVGLGIHGEPGVKREKLQPVDIHVTELYYHLKKSLQLQEKDKVAVLVNGLGATPLMELNIVARKILKLLLSDNISYHSRVLVGNYMTSIDMPGFSLSLLKLDNELEQLYDQKTITPALVIC